MNIKYKNLNKQLKTKIMGALTKPKAAAAAPVVTKKAAPAKAASVTGGIVAYCVKTKTKNVPMLEAVIDVSSNRYIAKGVDADGNKMTAIMSKASAEGHVAAKRAVRGTGWSK